MQEIVSTRVLDESLVASGLVRRGAVMKVAAGAIAIALLMAGGAQAAEVYVDFTGTLTGQTYAGVDPTFAVGDILNVSAQFDSSNLIQWGNTGYEVVGLYAPSPSAGLTIGGPGGAGWTAHDDFYDGHNLIYDNGGVFASSPALILKDGQVVGFYGYLQPSVSALTPALNLGSSITPSWAGNWGAITLSDSFNILQDNSYQNTATTTGFTGKWNFGDATVTGLTDPAPEPPQWLLMLAGSAALICGAWMRSGLARFRRQAAPAA
jgi:hypothetical protein